MILPPPTSTLFPYTTLFRSLIDQAEANDAPQGLNPVLPGNLLPLFVSSSGVGNRDRKSTRLNSSHSQISYAVFCLKKKNKENTEQHSRGHLRMIGNVYNDLQ